jgi:hypothetical protein
MGIGDHQLHAAQAAAHQALEEAGPEGLGLRRADVQADDLALAVGVGGHGDYHRHRHDAPAFTLLEVGGVEPQIRPVAGQRAVEEGANTLVGECREFRVCPVMMGKKELPHGPTERTPDTGCPA